MPSSTPTEEYDTANARTARYVYAPGIDQPLYMERGANRTFYHFDGSGSVVVALTGTNGIVSERYTYGPYGESTSTSAANNPYRYTGRELDAETGLYYYRARYYSPNLGRFLQPDPIGYADNLNLYGYVNSDPLNLTDPSGLLARETAARAYSFLNNFGSDFRSLAPPPTIPTAADLRASSQIKADLSTNLTGYLPQFGIAAFNVGPITVTGAITNSGNGYLSGGVNKTLNPLSASFIVGAGYVITAGASPDQILSGSSYGVSGAGPFSIIHSPGKGIAQVIGFAAGRSAPAGTPIPNGRDASVTGSTNEPTFRLPIRWWACRVTNHKVVRADYS